MNFHLSFFFIFKLFALLAAIATVACLWQISPWAFYALLCALIFKIADAVGEQAWTTYTLYNKELSQQFAASNTEEKK